ncbi:MAG: putative integral rane protein, partial [Bryobacterales bacterium]|nr:putative integral rane protein [Bryobacterales bacterium]
QEGKTKSTKKSFNSRAIFLALGGGILIGFHYPLVQLARDPDIGLGPYGIVFVFSAGVLFSTFVYNLFFMNLPIAGKVVDFSEYFKRGGKTHLLGMLGGALWAMGALASFVAARAEGAGSIGSGLNFAVGQGATLLAALWGLLVWKEFADADSKVKSLVTGTLVLSLTGILLVSLTNVYRFK